MAAHAPLQPAGISVSGGTFRSALQFADRSFKEQLMEVYGKENYLYLMELLGNKEVTTNHDFYHYETRGKLHSAVQVASIAPVSPTAGVSVTVTIAAGSHHNSGTQSPLRVGEVLEVSASGVQGKILTVNKAADGAHTATVPPLHPTDTFAPAANDWLLFKGAVDMGEKSGKVDNIQNLVRKVENTVTEIREDFEITDKAAMERVEFSVDGQKYFKYKGTKDAEKRFLNNVENKLVFGVNVTNTNITNGTEGTLGLIPQVASGGSDLGYTAGSMAITDFQSATRQLNFNGAPAEIHHLSDVYQNQEIQRLLFGTYDQGAVLWESVGGSAVAAAKYGFSSLAIDGYNFHFKKYAPFSPEAMYGVAPAVASAYKNYGLLIPQGSHRDPRTSAVRPMLTIMYQNTPDGEILSMESGGFAQSNRTPDMTLVNTLVTYKGLRLAAANQCIILQG